MGFINHFCHLFIPSPTQGPIYIDHDYRLKQPWDENRTLSDLNQYINQKEGDNVGGQKKIVVPALWNEIEIAKSLTYFYAISSVALPIIFLAFPVLYARHQGLSVDPAALKVITAVAAAITSVSLIQLFRFGKKRYQHCFTPLSPGAKEKWRIQFSKALIQLENSQLENS